MVGQFPISASLMRVLLVGDDANDQNLLQKGLPFYNAVIRSSLRGFNSALILASCSTEDTPAEIRSYSILSMRKRLLLHGESPTIHVVHHQDMRRLHISCRSESQE